MELGKDYYYDEKRKGYFKIEPNAIRKLTSIIRGVATEIEIIYDSCGNKRRVFIFFLILIWMLRVGYHTVVDFFQAIRGIGDFFKWVF